MGFVLTLKTALGVDYSKKEEIIKIFESKIPPPGLSMMVPNYQNNPVWNVAKGEFLQRHPYLCELNMGRYTAFAHLSTLQAMNDSSGGHLTSWLRGHGGAYTHEDAHVIKAQGTPDYATMALKRTPDGIAPMGDHAGIAAYRDDPVRAEALAKENNATFLKQMRERIEALNAEARKAKG